MHIHKQKRNHCQTKAKKNIGTLISSTLERIVSIEFHSIWCCPYIVINRNLPSKSALFGWTFFISLFLAIRMSLNKLSSRWANIRKCIEWKAQHDRLNTTTEFCQTKFIFKWAIFSLAYFCISMMFECWIIAVNGDVSYPITFCTFQCVPTIKCSFKRSYKSQDQPNFKGFELGQIERISSLFDQIFWIHCIPKENSFWRRQHIVRPSANCDLILQTDEKIKKDYKYFAWCNDDLWLYKFVLFSNVHKKRMFILSLERYLSEYLLISHCDCSWGECNRKERNKTNQQHDA